MPGDGIIVGDMTKQRFVVLDGLRGVAAFFVAYFHAGRGFGFPIYPAHAYLAVDFFFCLSGFVISYAYDNQIQNGASFAKFAALRLARLYPIIFISVIFGAVAFYCVPALRAQPGSILEATLLTMSAFTMIPAGLFFHLSAFPFDVPLWSLFFELVANFIYFFEVNGTTKSLTKYAIIFGCFGLTLVFIIYNVGSLETVGAAGWRSFSAAFSRVFYSFFAGVVIFRFNLYKLVPRTAPLGIALLLTLVFACPAIHTTWLYDAFAVICLFPLIVASGANTASDTNMPAVWSFLGQLSYPLYVMHEIVFRAMYNIFHDGRFYQVYPALFLTLSLALAVLVSYVILISFDLPVRRQLLRTIRKIKPGDVSMA
jgi:peptidoglycan/LPS O-acetylase OafA/YrhL